MLPTLMATTARLRTPGSSDDTCSTSPTTSAATAESAACSAASFGTVMSIPMFCDAPETARGWAEEAAVRFIADAPPMCRDGTRGGGFDCLTELADITAFGTAWTALRYRQRAICIRGERRVVASSPPPSATCPRLDGCPRLDHSARYRANDRPNPAEF